MTFDYTKSRGTADRLIARFGRSVTLRQYVRGGDYLDPTREPTDTTITAVDLNQTVRDTGGALASTSQRTLYVKVPAAVLPVKENEVVIDGATHKIAAVRQIAPGGTVIYYEIDLAG